MPTTADSRPQIIPGGIGDILVIPRGGQCEQRFVEAGSTLIEGSSGNIYLSKKTSHSEHGQIDQLQPEPIG